MNSITAKLFFIHFLALFSFISHILAQDAVPLSENGDKTTADFTKLFDKLYELGLPDVSKAQYVQLEGVGEKFISKTEKFRFNANGWLLKENKDFECLFIVNGCRTCKAFRWDTLQEIRNKEIEDKEAKEPEVHKKELIKVYYSHNYDGRCGANWKKASFNKNLDEFLSDGKAFDTAINDFGLSYLLFTAAEAYKLGYSEKANLLAGKLLKITGTEQKLLEEGINAIADAKYNESLDEFFDTGDWNELSRKLTNLVERYPTSWKNLPAIRRVADDVRKRASSNQAPEIIGEGLDDEDRVLAKELANIDNKKLPYFAYGDGYNQFYAFQDALWILKDPKRQKKYVEEYSIDKIKKRGIKSFPLLLALLKDEYPVNADIQRIRFDDPDFLYSRNRDSIKDPIEKQYEELRRPATRQDLAAYILDPIVLNYENIRNVSKEEFFKRYYDWYAQNKGKSDNELAKTYLTGPIRGACKDYQGLTFLVRNAYDMEPEAIEKYLLKSEYGISEGYVDLAKEYVVRRGSKAKDFAGKMVSKLEDWIKRCKEAEGKLPSWDIDRIPYTIPVFIDVINPRSDQELLDETLSDKSKFEENRAILDNRFAYDHSRERVKLILIAAVNAKDPNTTDALLTWLYQLYAMNKESKRRIISGGDPIDENVLFAEGPPSIAETAEYWKRLLNDNRKVQYKSPTDGKELTVGDQVLDVISCLYDDVDSYYKERTAKALLGDAELAVIKRTRMEKMLEGVKDPNLPRYPSSENVSPERKLELFDKLTKMKGADARRMISLLSDDEKLAIDEFHISNNKELSELWITANTIMKIESEVPEWENALVDIIDSKGKPVSKDICEKILNICKKLALEGKAARCEVQREALLNGVSIKIAKNPELKIIRTWDEKINMQEFGCVQGNFGYCATWSADPKKEKHIDKKYEEKLESYRKLFWEKVDDFCNGDVYVLGQQSFYFSGFPAE